MSLYFYTKAAVTPNILLQFLAQQLRVAKKEFLVVENYVDYLIQCGEEDREPSSQTIVEYQCWEGGEFEVQVEIYENNPLWEEEETRIAFLQQLSKFCQQPILADDGDSNPYTYLLIQPKGTVYPIALEVEALDGEEELLVVENYYNSSLGTFALKEPYQMAWLEEQLGQLLAQEIPQFKLEAYTSLLPIEQDAPPESQRLRVYAYHYNIKLKYPTPWLSKRKKATLLHKKMQAWAQQEALEICWFPADASKAISYQLGVTYEKHCWCYEGGRQEKIIYKKPDYKG